MPVQMRLSQADERFYSPDRDLAYCSPHLVHRAIKGLDPDQQEAWITDYLRANNVSDEQLVAAAKVLADYMNRGLADPKYNHPYEALTAVGFFELPKEVQVVVCAKLGQVFLSAIFSSIRDVVRKPEDPPYDTKQIADAAEKLVTKMVNKEKKSVFAYLWEQLVNLFKFKS